MNNLSSSGKRWNRWTGALALVAAVTLASASFAANDDAFLHQPPRETQGVVKVTLPPVAKPGEHPSLLLTKEELPQLKEQLKTTERGKEALKTLLNVANGEMGPINFPDPKGPLGQLKDRNDPVAKKHDRISLNCGNLGMAYTLTGDKKYADKAAEILKGYAQRYAEYPEHKGVNRDDTGKVMGQRLSEAMWLLPLAESYDEIYDSGALTEMDKKDIADKLLVAAVTFIRGKKTAAAEVAARDKRNPNWRTAAPPKGKGGPVGNWLNFYAAATMLTGAVTHNKDMLDLAAADYREYIQNGISDDGMWKEGAIGYQLFATSAMTTGMEAAARQGIDLWSFENNRFKDMFDSPLWYAYQDSTMPGINDSGRVTLGDWSTRVYDYGYLRDGDSHYADLVNRTPRQLGVSEGSYIPTRIYEKLPVEAAKPYPSMLFTNLGYGILRDKTRYVLLKGGHPSGVHEHLDKLNVILFDGDELGGVPVFHRYEDPLHDQWSKVSLANNTMTVDEHSQAIGSAKFLVFEDAGAVKLMRAETSDVYPGVKMDRTVVMVPDAVLDIYRGASDADHTWDATLRYHGALEGMPSPAAPTAPNAGHMLGAKDGYQHFNVLQRQPANTGWQGIWDTKVGKMQLDAAGVKGQEVIIGTGPDKDNMALLRQKGKTAIFAKAVKLEKAGPDVTSSKLLETSSPDLAAFEIKQGDSTTRVFVSYKAGKWKTADVASDAMVLVITGDGKTSQVVMTGGTSAKVGLAEMSFDKPGNYSANLADGKMTITEKWTPEK